MINVIILSLLQGVTEFLPISSSSHLIIISEYLDFQEQNLSIDVSLHIGSFLAVLTYFYKDIFNFFENKELFIKIVISSIPVIGFGYLLLKFNIIENIRSIEVIGWTTLIFGIMLYFSDKFNLDKTIKSNFTFKNAMIIGFFQVLSLVPGVSRSGITITAARFLDFKRFDSAKISFLLSIPTLGAVSTYGVSSIIFSENINFSILNLTAIIFSFIFSFLTIKYFLEYIKSFSLKIFVVYRVLLGLGIIILSYS